MEIIRPEGEEITVRYGILVTGDIFLLDDGVYMKSDERDDDNDRWSTNLATGALYAWEDCVEVTRARAHVVVD